VEQRQRSFPDGLARRTVEPMSSRVMRKDSKEETRKKPARTRGLDGSMPII